MREYIVRYSKRADKFMDCSEVYETTVAAEKIIQANKIAHKKFNKDTDYRVVSVELKKEK